MVSSRRRIQGPHYRSNNIARRQCVHRTAAERAHHAVLHEAVPSLDSLGREAGVQAAADRGLEVGAERSGSSQLLDRGLNPVAAHGETGRRPSPTHTLLQRCAVITSPHPRPHLRRLLAPRGCPAGQTGRGHPAEAGVPAVGEQVTQPAVDELAYATGTHAGGLL